MKIKSKMLNKNSKIKFNQSSGIYLLLLNYFDIKAVEGQEDVVNYIMSIASLSLLALLCFINIVIYFILINFIKKNRNNYTEILVKYPKLNWLIKRYENMNLWFLIFEILLLFIILMVIFISSTMIVHQMISV